MTEQPLQRPLPELHDSPAWEPTYTDAELRRRFGVTKPVVRLVESLARAVVGHHQRLGTPRGAWEPTPLHDEQLAGAALRQAEDLVSLRARAELDPVLDELGHSLAHVTALIEEAERPPRWVTTPESGATVAATEATALLDRHDTRIDADFAIGKTHHARSSPWLVALSRATPLLEAVGFLAFLTYFLDVSITRPQDDPLAWSFAASIVVVVILGQTWFVNHAARAHNEARDAYAGGHRHEAERATRRRFWHLGFAVATAVAVTGAMIDRGLVTVGEGGTLTKGVVVLLALVTGVVLPSLAYIATAFDGSKMSRERDSVADQLRADADGHEGLIDEVRAGLDQQRELGDLIRARLVPDIVANAQAVLDEVIPLHNLVRVQIGGLVGPSPVRPPRPPDGLPRELFTGLAGVRSVDLRPIADRMARLHAFDAESKALAARLRNLPPHPWTSVGHRRAA